jgi:hypothetical protein
MWTQNRLHSSIVKEQTGLAFGAIPATEPDARRGRRSIYPNSLEVKIDLKAVVGQSESLDLGDVSPPSPNGLGAPALALGRLV